MFRLKVRVRGAREAAAKFAKLRRTAPKIVDKTVEETSNEIVKKIVETIQGPPVSKPGNPPAKRTGHHASSFTVTGSGGKRDIGPTSLYGGYLEHGTSKMDPRPHIEPALDGAENTLADKLGERILAEL